MDIPTTSTTVPMDLTTTAYEKSRDKILNDVATTFWMVFIFYVFASVAWITYCVISYRRDMEMLKLTAQENGIARYLEIRRVTIFFSDAVARLLKAYDSVDIESLRCNMENNSNTEHT